MREFLTEIKFANPEYFWILLVIPLYVGLYLLRFRKQFADIGISNLGALKNQSSAILGVIVHLPMIFKLMAFALFVVVVARPQSFLSKQKVSNEGIDIVMAMDISSSMLAEDFKPNRLGASIEVAKAFVDLRPNDRIGLVVFAGESFTQCPITTDHKVVKDALDKLESGMVEDGTAIGMGLATAVDRLKDSESKSKVVILMTDGVNNQGIIDPKTAADLAKTFGIRVYTIGVGTKGMAPYPFMDPFNRKTYQNIEVEIDEDLLKYIAELTGVDYYRATDNNKLKGIFTNIDKLEKTRIEVASFQRYDEKFLPFAIAGGILLLLAYFIKLVIIKQIP